MAYIMRGKRIGFDNIAVGSATGLERTIAGGGGELTSVYGGKTENFRTACGSSYTSARQKEKLWKTVCSGLTTDVTTNGDPGF
jgi:hypothetical protein